MKKHFLIAATVTIGLGAIVCSAYAEEWQSMSSAPRDGTVIEIKNNYGVMPWYDIYKWADAGFTKGTWCSGGCVDKNWQSVDHSGHSLDPRDEKYMQWRSHVNTGNYVDPTGGAQNTVGYWTGHNDPTPLGDDEMTDATFMMFGLGFLCGSLFASFVIGYLR